MPRHSLSGRASRSCDSLCGAGPGKYLQNLVKKTRAAPEAAHPSKSTITILNVTFAAKGTIILLFSAFVFNRTKLREASRRMF